MCVRTASNILAPTRYNEIERANKHLLDRMTDIIVHPKPLYPDRNGGGRGSVSVRDPSKTSLNANFRKRELERITKENY
jgi:hypothetical protein